MSSGVLADGLIYSIFKNQLKFIVYCIIFNKYNTMKLQNEKGGR
jgi:hypothetical protein